MRAILTVFTLFMLASFLSPAHASENQTESDSNPVFTVTYFFSEPRCKTCRTIESLTRETVEGSFAGELGEGQLTFRLVDTDQEENQHYVDDFQLITKSVVITEEKNGTVVRFKILQKVWELVHDPGAFRKYITDEVRAFMTSPSS